MTFGQTAELFIADLHTRQLRRARETELEVKRHFAEWWSRPVGAITKADVLHVVGNIVQMGLCTLPANASRLFGFAYDRDLISQIPTDRLRLSKIVGARPPRERVLTDDEIRAVWAAAGQVGVGGILLKTLLLTALRRG